MPRFRRRGDRSQPATGGPRLSYADRLGYIGRQLDAGKLRWPVILEVSGSFVVRALDEASGQLHLTELVEDDFRHVDLRPNTARPDSYEVMLRALGMKLDVELAGNVAIVEGPAAFQVSGWRGGEAAGLASYVAFDARYDRESLQQDVSSEG